MTDQVAIETVRVGAVGERELLADLYRPSVSNGCGVLLVFGGGFTFGDRKQLGGYAIALGRAGYTSLACEYRLASESLWPAQVDDVLTAFDYFHAEARTLGLSPSKLAVSGNSAGGCLALLVAGQRSNAVAAVVAFYPPVDFLGDDTKSKMDIRDMRYLVGEDVTEEKLAAMSPINFVSPSFPPTLLMHGNRDERVHWKESARMYEKLIDVGAGAEIHIFDGLEHAYDLQPKYGHLSATIVTRFLDQHLLTIGGIAAKS
ncbi:MAG: alpha/beta hydrolase [Acidimicrobiales bacterium]